MASPDPDRRFVRPALAFFAFCSGSLGLLTASARGQGTTERVSVTSSGAQADDASLDSALSADGRFVLFDSKARNLVPGDANQAWDVFVHERQTGMTTRLSVDSSGTEGNGDSFATMNSSISADGRYVVFASVASNLVAGDGNGKADVFLHDRQTHSTVRLSVDAAGVEGDGDSFEPALSGDGRYVVFTSFAANLAPVPAQSVPTIYLHDRLTGQKSLVCLTTSGAQANDYSVHPAISADGRFVAFRSLASNFVAGDPADIFSQIYVRELAAGVTTRVSVSSQGAPARSPHHSTFLHTDDPSISADGRFVGFTSKATNLVPGDDNAKYDVFLHDRLTATTTRVSVGSTGAQADGDSTVLRMSADARLLAFSSDADNLVPGDTTGGGDAFVHDRLTGATTRVSVRSDGRQATGAPPGTADAAIASSVSADGRFIAYGSQYANLVAGDSNAAADVFVHDRASPVPGSYCSSKVDSTGCAPAMSFSGLPSATSSAPFDVRASPVQSRRAGVLFYALAHDLERFQGGVLCIAPPLRRRATVTSGGNTPPDCSGVLSFDFNARIRSGVDADLFPGTVVYAQYFYRDPGDLSGHGTGLSDALRFVIQP
jgi:Tol biopolymer transport system component